MTENKPIIIDGIDISKCECSSQIDLDVNIICTSNFPSKKSGYCKDNTNCLYKQLTHKTQECEYWKHQAELGSDTTDRLAKQLEEKEQECEELKERLNSRCFDAKSNNNRCISYNRIAEDYERDLQQLDQLNAEKAKLEAQIEADTQYHVKEEYNLRNIIRNKEKRNAELYKENNQLKAENEMWQKELDKTHLLMLQRQDELIKAEQKLERIREIAMTIMDDDVEENSCYWDARQILQIIDEVIPNEN